MNESPAPAAAPGDSLRRSVSAIEDAHPLRMPVTTNLRLTVPRLDRLEAKTAYLVEYIAYLEARIATLEARDGSPS